MSAAVTPSGNNASLVVALKKSGSVASIFSGTTTTRIRF